MRTLFSGARARVLLTLLVRHEHWFGIKELSETAKVSTGTASEVLKALENLDWVKSGGAGPNKLRNLDRPSALLDAWRDHVSATRQTKLQRYYIPYLDKFGLADHIAKHLEAHLVLYAITGEAGAQHYTHTSPIYRRYA
jgi:hypothetical protein